MYDIKTKNPTVILVIVGILIEVCYLYFLISQDGQRNILNYMFVYAIAFFLTFGLYLFIREKKLKNKNDSLPPLHKNRLLILILLFGILFRITLIPSLPSTSDDVYRYLWEGKCSYNGFNPFDYPPSDERLNDLHSELLPEKVTFKDMPSIYPTVSQLVFLAGYSISGESDTGLKIIYLLAEILTLFILVKILKLRNQNENLIILYAWLPLPIMEFFINSHIDVVGITFFTIFIYFFLKSRYLTSAPFFVLAVFVKLYPLIIAPLLIKKMGLKKTLIFGIIVLILSGFLIWPIFPSEKTVSQSLFAYLSSWSFNGSVYTFFYGILENGYLARKITLIGFLLCVGVISISYKDFLRGIYGVWICFIIFAATLYPWYLGWITALHPFVAMLSVSSLLFTINFTNFTPMGEIWKEYWWIYLIQYLPFYLLLSYELYNMFRKRKISKPKNTNH